MSYSISFAKSFVKRYGKLTAVEQRAVDGKIRILAENPWHPSLRVKKIQSTDGIFECSVNMDIRIAFVFEGDKIILLLDVDHHDKLLNRQARS